MVKSPPPEILKPRISKYTDACGFSFFNDGECIADRTKIVRGGLCGFVKCNVPPCYCGFAEFICGGTVSAWRLYLPEPLTADVPLGAPVFDPVDGQFLGYAIYYDIGRRPADIGVDEASASMAAFAGEECIVFVAGCGIKPCECGGGVVDPVADKTTVIYTDPSAVTSWPISTPDGKIVSVASIYVPTNAGEVFDADAYLASLPKDGVPEGYVVKLHNTGDGTIAKAADLTGDVIEFPKNGYVCVICSQGQWIWA